MSKKSKSVKGTFTSVWSDCGEITTEATLDVKTGQIYTKAVDVSNCGSLESEVFEDEDGNDYNVCPVCHEYVLKTVMQEDRFIHTCLDEQTVCSNPDCDYNN